MIMKSIAVFCGSGSGKNGSFLNVARKLGKALAEKDVHLVYGGAKIGLMGAVANGSLENGGTVIGVIPHFLKTKEVAHDQLSQLISVSSMHERKVKMYELADGFIILPGGFGTMEEFFEILSWAQLGLHQKPIGVLNVDGYYDHLWQLFDHMLSEQLIRPSNLDMILQSTQIEDLLERMNTYQPPATPNLVVNKENL